MHEVTIHDLDTQLAEQLPARELMGGSWMGGSRYDQPTASHSYNIAAAGNGNGNDNYSLVSANGNSVAVSLFGNSAAGNNYAAAGN
ncbi:MAG TPA: hypothetical protein VG325_12500 [Solirubrobacteraceae bacterium]|jgi:hypothetical protein|nr:hypothetical protein [Solirubrobacteraceae bacterium]